MSALTTTRETSAPAAIAGFTGEHRWLSNFWPAAITLAGVSWPTVEHAFQAMKTADPVEREAIRQLETPGRAKRAGSRLTLRPDWDDARIPVMRLCLTVKFTQHADLAELLIATGSAHLEEANAWGDTFWGTAHGVGHNHLGRLLMHLRSELATARIT